MDGNIHEGTLCKHCDKGAFLELKNYLTKNAGVSREKKKQIRMLDVGCEEFYMGV